MTPTLLKKYLVVQPYGRKPREATIVESFDAVEDAYEALDWMAERLHEQGIDPDSFGFRVTDRTYRAVALSGRYRSRLATLRATTGGLGSALGGNSGDRPSTSVFTS